MRKIPHPVERKILQPLIDSDHEVMLPLQNIISAWLENKEIDSMVALIKDWVDDLQNIYDRAERVDELENTLYHIDDAIDAIEDELNDIRKLTGAVNV
jgi:hypothetical protein